MESTTMMSNCPPLLLRRKQRCRPASLLIADAHLLQSRIYLKQHRLDLAAQEAEACIDLRRKSLPMMHPAVAEALLGTLFLCAAALLALQAPKGSHALALCRLCGGPVCCRQVHTSQDTGEEGDGSLQADTGRGPPWRRCRFHTDDALL